MSISIEVGVFSDDPDRIGEYELFVGQGSLSQSDILDTTYQRKHGDITSGTERQTTDVCLAPGNTYTVYVEGDSDTDTTQDFDTSNDPTPVTGDGTDDTDMADPYVYDTYKTNDPSSSLGTDDDGGEGFDTSYEFTLSTPPSADASNGFSGTTSIVEGGTSISFDGSASSDPDGDSLSYSWTFEDGSSAPGVTTSYDYSDAVTTNGGSSTFSPDLTVDDGTNLGGSDTDSNFASITVYNDFDGDGLADDDSATGVSTDDDDDDDGITDGNDPAPYNVYPSASDSSSESTDEDSTLTVNDGDNADLTELATDGYESYDPNTDPISIEQIDGEGFSAGSTVTLDSGATVTVSDDGSWTYDPNGQYDSLSTGDATDEFTYIISDDPHSGTAAATEQGTVSITINGVNSPPTAPTDDDGANNEVAEDDGTDTAVGITASSTDPEGNTAPTFTLTDDANGRFQIDSSTGKVTVDDASQLDHEAANSHTITVDASDRTASSTKDFTIDVTDIDEMPAFTSGTSSTVAESATGSTVVHDVDADVDGGDDEGVSYAITAGNDDVAGNGGGAFAVDSSGQITVSDTEDVDESRQSSFLLTVEASEGTATNTQDIDITVTDDVAPTFQADSSTPADDATDYAPSNDIQLEFDEDVALDSGNIKIVDDSEGSSTQTLDVTDSAVSASGSTVTVSPSSTLEPETNYHVEVDSGAIEDGFGNSYGGVSDATIYSFTTASTDPSFTSPSPASVSVDEDGSVDLTTVLEVRDISASDDLTWRVTSAPSNGSLAGVDGNTATGLAGNDSPHTLSTSPTYTPDPEFNDGGTPDDSFEVQVDDTNPGTSDTISVDVTVAGINDAPSIEVGSDQTVMNNTTQQTVSNVATNFDPGGGSDESTQRISDFLITNDNNGLFASQLDINNDGTLTFTPADGVQGTATVEVQVIDDGGTTNGGTDTSAPSRFNITVDNRGPTITDLSANNPSGQNVNVSFESDEPLSTISVSISDAESATLDEVNFSETDTGDGTYTYEATYSGSADGSYNVSLDTIEDTAGNSGETDESDSVDVSTGGGGGGGGGIVGIGGDDGGEDGGNPDDRGGDPDSAGAGGEAGDNLGDDGDSGDDGVEDGGDETSGPREPSGETSGDEEWVEPSEFHAVDIVDVQLVTAPANSVNATSIVTLDNPSTDDQRIDVRFVIDGEVVEERDVVVPGTEQVNVTHSEILEEPGTHESASNIATRADDGGTVRTYDFEIGSVELDEDGTELASSSAVPPSGPDDADTGEAANARGTLLFALLGLVALVAVILGALYWRRPD